MTQSEVDELLARGFIFGTEVMATVYGPRMSSGNTQTQVFEYLSQVAEGSATLGRTPAEVSLDSPELNVEALGPMHARLVEDFQSQAQSILRAFADAE